MAAAVNCVPTVRHRSLHRGNLGRVPLLAKAAGKRRERHGHLLRCFGGGRCPLDDFAREVDGHEPAGSHQVCVLLVSPAQSAAVRTDAAPMAQIDMSDFVGQYEPAFGPVEMPGRLDPR